MQGLTRQSSAVARPPYAYRPAGVLWLSLACHVLGLGAILLAPGTWPWIVSGLVLNHVVLGLIGLWPRSQMLGENIVRIDRKPGETKQALQIALTIDDGPDPMVTPAVLDCLDRHDAKASFFCIGERAARYPELVAQIVQRGHSIENHSQHHSYAFACFGPWRLLREIQTAQRVLAELAGCAPHYFRAPAGLRNPFLAWVMARSGLHYVSWTRRGYDAVQKDAGGVLRRLERGLAPGDILLLHDGSAARTASGEPVILAVLPALLATIHARGLRAVSLRTALGAAEPIGGGSEPQSVAQGEPADASARQRHHALGSSRAPQTH